jgi:hypothetical protein
VKNTPKQRRSVAYFLNIATLFVVLPLVLVLVLLLRLIRFGGFGFPMFLLFPSLPLPPPRVAMTIDRTPLIPSVYASRGTNELRAILT